MENHQYENAKLLADKDAAVVIEEKNLSAKVLCEAAEKLLEDKKLRQDMENNVYQFSNLSANKLIYDEIINLVSENIK